MKNGISDDGHSYGARKYLFLAVMFFLILTVFITKYGGTYFIHIRDPEPQRGALFNINVVNNFIEQTETRHKKVQHIICPIFAGRSGNHLFQYASSYAIARLKGMKLVISSSLDLLQYFNLKADIRKDTSICSSRNVKIIKEGHSAVFDKRLVEFNNTSDVRLTMYLQSYLYFDQYSQEIRQQFTFKDEIRNKAVSFLESKLLKFNITRKSTYNINRKNNYIQTFKGTSGKDVTLVGVHIRRGDFAEHPEVGYQVASKEYLERAVNWYQATYKNLLFVVISNGMAWAKQNMPKNIKVLYLEAVGRSAWDDLATVTLCDHFIATVGTYSWWAGWLTGGNVTYYKWPAKEGSRFRKSFSKDYKDHYYPQWVGL